MLTPSGAQNVLGRFSGTLKDWKFRVASDDGFSALPKRLE